jgi:hypothetical protein
VTAIKRPDKAALADLIGTVLASLRNHAGKRIQQVNEGIPARWELRAPSGTPAAPIRYFPGLLHGRYSFKV